MPLYRGPRMGMLSSRAAVAASAPSNTAVPAITGTAQEGQTLSASTGTWTGFPTPTYTYVWNRAGSAISGATSSTYTLVSGDVGSTITVTVTATNTSGSVSATSSATATVTAAGGSTNPTSIFSSATSGQIGWWSAGVAGSMRSAANSANPAADGEAVQRFDDQSVSATNITISGASQPTYGATSYASGPGLNFNGTSNSWQKAQSAAPTKAVLFARLKPLKDGAGDLYLSLGHYLASPSTSIAFFDLGSATAGKVNMAMSINGNTISLGDIDEGTDCRCIAIADGTNVSFYINTVLVSAIPYSGTIGAFGSLYFMGGNGSGGSTSGKMGLKCFGYTHSVDCDSTQRGNLDTWMQNPT